MSLCQEKNLLNSIFWGVPIHLDPPIVSNSMVFYPCPIHRRMKFEEVDEALKNCTVRNQGLGPRHRFENMATNKMTPHHTGHQVTCKLQGT